MKTIFERFEQHLVSQDASLHTIRGYLGNLRQFAAWFEQTNGTPFALENVTPTDIRE